MEPELLAYHYEQAGLTGPAVDYWHRAARRDAERSANIEALNHFNRALDLLKDLPQGPERNALELELLTCTRSPLAVRQRICIRRNGTQLSKGEGVVTGAQRFRASVSRHSGIMGHSIWSEGTSPMLAAWPKISSLWLHREQSSDLLIEAHHALGATYFFLGRFDEARTHLLAAKSL